MKVTAVMGVWGSANFLDVVLGFVDRFAPSFQNYGWSLQLYCLMAYFQNALIFGFSGMIAWALFQTFSKTKKSERQYVSANQA